MTIGDPRRRRAFGLRVARTTSDFYVASRSVGPVLNASAIGGEYLSAASFLGVAGLVLRRGVDMLWYPVGWTAGYLAAAGLRGRAAAPLGRLHAAGLRGVPASSRCGSDGRQLRWSCLIGAALPGAAVPGRRADPARGDRGAHLGRRGGRGGRRPRQRRAGGMRSITLVQAFQYWLKLAPCSSRRCCCCWSGSATGRRARHLHARDWVEPLPGPHAMYLDLLADPRDVPRHHGSAARGGPLLHQPRRPRRPSYDGGGARRCSALFYLLPTLYGVLGRVYASDLVATGRTDSVVLELPDRVLGGPGGDLLTALLAAGAFAAFLSTSSGLVVSVGGVLSQDLLGRRFDGVPGFRHRQSCSPRWRLRADAGLARARRWRTRSSWPSPSRRRRSARCSCSASGGVG